MQAVDMARLQQIAAQHSVNYSAPSALLSSTPVIKTAMEKKFPESKAKLFDRIANLGDHTRLFSHLTAINTITSDQVANVIGKNQMVIVEGLAEGGSKLGVKLVTLYPPDRIECELYTDLFDSRLPTPTGAQPASASPPWTAVAANPQDKKKGFIVWSFKEEGPTTTTMRIESEFEVSSKSNYVRGAIDHVWLDFFENVMIDTGEITSAQKLCAPFPNKP